MMRPNVNISYMRLFNEAQEQDCESIMELAAYIMEDPRSTEENEKMSNELVLSTGFARLGNRLIHHSTHP